MSEEEITIVYDAAVDERFLDNPFVTNSIVKFYAGVFVVTHENYKLDTLFFLITSSAICQMSKYKD